LMLDHKVRLLFIRQTFSMPHQRSYFSMDNSPLKIAAFTLMAGYSGHRTRIDNSGRLPYQPNQ